MKIVAGKYGGRRLSVPQNRDIRPTSDKVRGAVFNMLSSRGEVENARVLDAFCGTGALGLEALSRGAVHCSFMDKARDSLALAKENAQNLGAEPYASFDQRDVRKIGMNREGDAGAYDLVFLDPPYRQGLIVQAIHSLREGGWLRTGAWLVCESENNFLMSVMDGVEIESKKTYGDTKISLLINKL